MSDPLLSGQPVDHSILQEASGLWRSCLVALKSAGTKGRDREKTSERMKLQNSKDVLKNKRSVGKKNCFLQRAVFIKEKKIQSILFAIFKELLAYWKGAGAGCTV